VGHSVTNSATDPECGAQTVRCLQLNRMGKVGAGQQSTSADRLHEVTATCYHYVMCMAMVVRVWSLVVLMV